MFNLQTKPFKPVWRFFLWWQFS